MTTSSQPAYSQVNARAWNQLARGGSDASRPFSPEQIAHPEQWLPDFDLVSWEEVQSVLCLGGGGGQQGPLLAAMGLEVTVADLSEEQLRRDRETAARHGLRLTAVELDMLDLSVFDHGTFDLVYQPVSSLYVPSPRALYREVARVLRAEGLYRVEHVNPTHLQISEQAPWDGQAYRLERRQDPEEAISWQYDTGEGILTCWHYVHSLELLIGGLLEAGFDLLSLTERADGDVTAAPGSQRHLAAYVPTFFTLFARLRP